MKIGVIDIGTNTVLLLIARFDAHGTLKTIRDEQRVIRVGEGVDATKRINPQAIARLNNCLNDLKSIARDSDEVDTLVVFATSAFRSAENAEEVLQAVKDDANIDIEILSGEDEARWTYTGATFGLSIAPDSYVTVLDIGGGSTEVVVGNNDNIAFGHSYDIGVVRLREKFFRQYPILPNERAGALACINKAFRPLHQQQYWIKKPTLIGVAGTATTLACLAKRLDEYDAERVGGTILTYDKVNELSAMLQRLTLGELRVLPCVDENRADVLPAGALLLEVFMHQFGFSSMLVSERGVRYGMAIREWGKRRGDH